jgi:hypothetical protein
MHFRLELGRLGIFLAYRWYDVNRDEVRTLGRIWRAPNRGHTLFGA